MQLPRTDVLASPGDTTAFRSQASGNGCEIELPVTLQDNEVGRRIANVRHAVWVFRDDCKYLTWSGRPLRSGRSAQPSCASASKHAKARRLWRISFQTGLCRLPRLPTPTGRFIISREAPGSSSRRYAPLGKVVKARAGPSRLVRLKRRDYGWSPDRCSRS